MSWGRLPATRRRVLTCGAILVVAAAALVGWWGISRGSGQSSAATVRGTARSPAASQPSRIDRLASPSSRSKASSGADGLGTQPGDNEVVVPAWTLVATIRAGGAPGSATPGGATTRLVPGQWWQASSVLPVIDQRPGWVQVQLAQRPNGSVAWVRSADVSLATDPYYIVVELGHKRVHLYMHGHQVASFPAGVGVSSAPTPTGRFFVALFAKAPTPAYGSFVIVTSAHSNVISDWQESGDAITAIHGPLGSDAAIGASGAAVSNGCIRLHESDLTKLRPVPAGTPIDIVE